MISRQLYLVSSVSASAMAMDVHFAEIIGLLVF
jgi:hypothetical protein